MVYDPKQEVFMEKLSLAIPEAELSGEGSGLSALLANFKTFTLEDRKSTRLNSSHP